MPISKEGLIIETLFRIPDKEGVDVDFVLNDAQRDIDATLTGRDLVPKARQRGISSYFLARYTAACLRKRNVRAVVISHDQESTQRMLNRVQYFVGNLRGPAPSISHMSKNEIMFDKMNSMFYIGTAGARAFGRGDTITHLLCSEYAYWPNPLKIMTGLLQAVPTSGEVAIESTGNGVNDYAARCLRAAKGASHYAVHFLPWHTSPEYLIELTEEEKARVLATIDVALEEDKVLALGPERILWRRQKLEELDYDLRRFKQEYPMTLDECFQASGESIFYKVQFEKTSRWQERGRGEWILYNHPKDDLHYVLGADVSGGVRKDASVIEAVCLETMEQVGEYISNKIPPDEFASLIAQWGARFNNAYVVVESNNHGLVTLSHLREIYPSELVHKKISFTEEGQLMDLGLRTTSRTKPLMIGVLRRLLAEELVVHSELLMAELSTFVEDDSGALGASSGCFDDTVMALACAGMGVEKAVMQLGLFTKREAAKRAPGCILFDEQLEELHSRRFGFPIARQDWI